MTSLIFIGASTAVVEISELISDINRVERKYEIVGALDDDPSLHNRETAGVPVLGPISAAKEFPDAKFVFAIGSHRTRILRYQILDRLGISDERFETLKHPAAKIYPSVVVGHGCIVHKGVVIAGDAVLEPFVIVTYNAVIGPFTRVGRCAMITTLAYVGSKVEIGPCAFIGATSAIADGSRIGPGAMVGMASVIYRHVAPGMFVMGNPARSVYPVRVPSELLCAWDRNGVEANRST